MYRIPPPELVELAKLLERNHFNDKSGLRPTKTVVNRSPSFPKTKSAVNKLDEQFKAWRVATSDAEEKMKKCRSAFDKALEARDRLKEAKKDRAQQIRDELNKCKITRLAKRAEEQELLLLKSRSRMTAWEMERQHRRETSEKIQRKREAINLIKEGQRMMTLESNQQAEIERFIVLRNRMLETQARRMVPQKMLSEFHAFKNPGKPLFLEQTTHTRHGLNTRRPSLYDRHVKKTCRLREATAAATCRTPVSNDKKEIDHSLVRESEFHEAARINHEVTLLEK